MDQNCRSIEVQEELSDLLMEVTKKRCEVPNQCKELQARIVNLQQSHVENTIILPKANTRKLVCKYSLKKPLFQTLNLPKGKIDVQELPFLMETLSEKQKILKKVMEIAKKKH